MLFIQSARESLITINFENGFLHLLINFNGRVYFLLPGFFMAVQNFHPLDISMEPESTVMAAGKRKYF